MSADLDRRVIHGRHTQIAPRVRFRALIAMRSSWLSLEA